ncbi:nuclear transport factor 2 family protein [Ruicaihuangia caeni]|uniref:nuclear transport factor 2 family protein n=1 Tax=Ruicaihuangia caeni TaxID=3042517 RepID=UPI00338FA7A1
MTATETITRELSLEERITRLEDIHEINNLKAKYVEACDNDHDPVAFSELFAEDGSWEGPGHGKYTGRENIKKFIEEIRGDYLWCAHYLIRPWIEISESGTEATAEWYAHIYEVVKDENGNELSELAFARYYDTLSKIDGKWYLQTVRAESSRLWEMGKDWIRA